MSADGPLVAALDRFGEGLERWSADPENFRPCAGCGEELSNLLQGSDGAYRCDPCEAQRLERERATRAVLQAAKNREQGLRSLAKVPERYLTPFDSTPPPCDVLAFRACLEEWAGEPWSLLLWGKVGNGKSMLAVETLYRAMLRGRRPLFVRASRISGVYYERAPAEKDRLLGAEVLLVDEVGVGHPGGGWEAVSDLISTRWEAQAPTLFTSNFSLRQLAEQGGAYGGRIADRLNDGLVLPMTGPTRRGFKG